MSSGPQSSAHPAASLPGPPLWRRLAYPSTSAGWWSVGLVLLFLFFLESVFYWGARPGHDRRTFFSDWVMAFTLIGTAASGVVAGVVAGVALARRERSVVVVFALALGLFVLSFAIGELIGHQPQ